jgi:dipeptidase E
MPVSEPEGFHAFNLVPFQINPHYTDKNPPGHAGETREDRIMEFLEVNRNMVVLGLREGCILRIEGSQMNLIGDRSLRIFRYGTNPEELDHTQDLSLFLKKP